MNEENKHRVSDVQEKVQMFHNIWVVAMCLIAMGLFIGILTAEESKGSAAPTVREIWKQTLVHQQIMVSTNNVYMLGAGIYKFGDDDNLLIITMEDAVITTKGYFVSKEGKLTQREILSNFIKATGLENLLVVTKDGTIKGDSLLNVVSIERFEQDPAGVISKFNRYGKLKLLESKKAVEEKAIMLEIPMYLPEEIGLDIVP